MGLFDTIGRRVAGALAPTPPAPTAPTPAALAAELGERWRHSPEGMPRRMPEHVAEAFTRRAGRVPTPEEVTALQAAWSAYRTRHSAGGRLAPVEDDRLEVLLRRLPE